MLRLIRKNSTKSGAKIRHLVIGHSQIIGCWDYQYEEEELNFDIDWICMPNGKTEELCNVLATEFQESKVPLRVSAIIWQNSIQNLSLLDVKEVVRQIETILSRYPEHRVALPECQFVPAQAAHFEHIAKTNMILAEFNKCQGYNRYPLFRSVMRQRKALHVKQEEWTEFQNNTGPGYNIADKKKYTKFIRKFHLNNLENASSEPWTPINIDVTRILAVLSPPNEVIDPSSFERTEDSSHPTFKHKQSETVKSPRKRLNAPYNHESEQSAPKDKRKYETDPKENIHITFRNDKIRVKEVSPKASTPISVNERNSKTQREELENWIDQGSSKGYIKHLIKTVEKRTKQKLRKLKEKRTKRKHSKMRKHRSKKKKSKRTKQDESSDVSSSSSSESTSSSSTNSDDSTSSDD